MNEPSPTQGLRALLIEDNYLAAVALRGILTRMGCEVVGPLATLEAGLQAAREETLDVAFLDINLVGGTSYAIADALIAHGCAVFFVSGYSSPSMTPPALMGVPTLRKPVDDTSVRRAIEQVVAGCRMTQA